MSTNKNTAQIRGDVLADIEAVRLGLMPKETAAVIFDGYKLVVASLNTEVAVFKASMQAKAVGVEFVKAIRLGKLVVNGDEGE